MNIKIFYKFSHYHFIFVIFACVLPLLGGCYSFTGGSVPPHLKTLYIESVNDASGFGNPLYGNQLTQLLIENFESDGSFEIVESGGDARLSITISSIRENPVTVNPGELETERKVTVSCKINQYDNIKKVVLIENSASAYEIYQVADAQAGRDQAIETALEQLSDDILLMVVSGW